MHCTVWRQSVRLVSFLDVLPESDFVSCHIKWGNCWASFRAIWPGSQKWHQCIQVKFVLPTAKVVIIASLLCQEQKYGYF